MKMVKTKTRMMMWIGLVVMFATQSLAADPGAIELRATASKLVVLTDADGNETTTMVEPEVVVPGDKIAYTISAKNVSADQVEGVVITDPIPAEMFFVAGSEESEAARVLFSVDGGNSFDREDRLTVIGEGGVRRPAMSTDFTHIQWVFESPLAPATERSVRFVAVVE